MPFFLGRYFAHYEEFIPFNRLTLCQKRNFKIIEEKKHYKSMLYITPLDLKKKKQQNNLLKPLNESTVESQIPVKDNKKGRYLILISQIF